MKFDIKQTNDGYEVTIVLTVQRWTDIVAELRQWMKLMPEESQEN